MNFIVPRLEILIRGLKEAEATHSSMDAPDLGEARKLAYDIFQKIEI